MGYLAFALKNRNPQFLQAFTKVCYAFVKKLTVGSCLFPDDESGSK